MITIYIMSNRYSSRARTHVHTLSHTHTHAHMPCLFNHACPSLFITHRKEHNPRWALYYVWISLKSRLGHISLSTQQATQHAHCPPLVYCLCANNGRSICGRCQHSSYSSANNYLSLRSARYFVYADAHFAVTNFTSTAAAKTVEDLASGKTNLSINMSLLPRVKPFVFFFKRGMRQSVGSIHTHTFTISTRLAYVKQPIYIDSKDA